MEDVFGSLFGKKKGMPKKGGHVLGGNTEQSPPPQPSPSRRLDITFCNKSLGLHLGKVKSDGSTIVKTVEENSEASRAGVRSGFKIIKFEGNKVETYEGLVDMISSYGRPCRITFEDNRPPPQVPPPAKMKKQTSAEENATRREAALKAAEMRTGAWDKKMAGTRVAKAQSVKQEKIAKQGDDNADIKFASESSAAFEAAKQKEADEAQRLGFNPYQPIFGSASQGRAAVEAVATGEIAPTMGRDTTQQAQHYTSPPVSPSSGFSGGGVAPSEGQDGNMMIASDQLSEALALISSHSSEVSEAALSTCLKIMTNLRNNFSEEKFHKVRMNNKAFNKKVATVSGGLELMGAAGFQLVSEEATDEMVLTYPMLATPDDDLVCAIQHLQLLCPS